MSDLRECHEEVSRVGSSEPCDKTAVALRIDTDGHRYPVCAYHAVRPMVALVDVIREAQAEALEAEAARTETHYVIDQQNKRHPHDVPVHSHATIDRLVQAAAAYRVGEGGTNNG